MAELGDVFDELLIFLGRPEAFSKLLLVAARMPAHLESNYSAMLLPKAQTRNCPKIPSFYRHYCFKVSEREREKERVLLLDNEIYGNKESSQ